MSKFIVKQTNSKMCMIKYWTECNTGVSLEV